MRKPLPSSIKPERLSMISDEASSNKKGAKILLVHPDRCRPNPFQPRTVFAREPLESLIESIRVEGILQPLLVRQEEDGNYTIIMGERRWRAARELGLPDIPVTLRKCSDEELENLALVENIQRESLSLVEEILSIGRLLEIRKQTSARAQEEVAKGLGKNVSFIKNRARFLALGKEVLEQLGKSPKVGFEILDQVLKLPEPLRNDYVSKLVAETGDVSRLPKTKVKKDGKRSPNKIKLSGKGPSGVFSVQISFRTKEVSPQAYLDAYLDGLVSLSDQLGIPRETLSASVQTRFEK